MTTKTATVKPTIDKKFKNLKYYQNKAIDFSRRNRLLKYPSKATSIEFEVGLAECENYFGKISELNIDLNHKAILEQDLDGQERLITDEDIKEYDDFLLPKTNITGKKLITQLDKLRLQAKNNYDSHGLHTLFLAIGEVKWREELAGRGSSEAISDFDYIAPLLLIPVAITNQKSPYKRSVITINDELYDIQINPVLKLFIKQELELRLPDVLEDFSQIAWIEIDKILKEFKKIFKEKNIDCDVSTKIRLGQFTFHGQQIYEDLTRNEESIVANDFVSSLCGDSQIIQSSELIESDNEDEVDNFLTEEEDFTIVDADESQLRAIKSVVEGKHMVIHGPPGTGKSQTIANLIANLLARGKKVLFVCEKQVALDVVFNRLKTKGADVSDLCLPLFQYTTDKKLFAKSIIESRNRVVSALRSVSRDSINLKLAQRKDRMDLLKRYADSLLTKVDPLDKTVYWIHGELAKVQSQTSDIVFPWKGATVKDVNFVSYGRIINILNNINEFSDLIFDQKNHWKEINRTSFTPDYTSRLIGKLEELQRIIRNFPKLSGTVFGNPQNISDVENIINFYKNNNINDLLSNRFIVSEIFDANHLKKELDVTKEILLILNKYDEIKANRSYKVPNSWECVGVNNVLVGGEVKICDLFNHKSQILLIKEKIENLNSLITSNKHSALLFSLNGESFSKYKNLFTTDPIVQKIKGWDERLTLYETLSFLKQVKIVYDKLIEAQEVVNEWSVDFSDKNIQDVWDIEHRFSTKYKTFFRLFNSNYTKDLETISGWCLAHRPQKFQEYKKIVFASADKIRLQAKFERMLNDFVKNFAIDDSIKSVSLVSLIDSISKIISYLEKADIDRLTSEIKTLVSETSLFDSLRQIVSLYEDLLTSSDTLNGFTVQATLNKSISAKDYINYASEITSETLRALSLYERAKEFLGKEPVTLSELILDIKALNELKEEYDRLDSLKPLHFVCRKNIDELFGAQDSIILQQKQIQAVIGIIDDKKLSKNDYYLNIESLSKDIKIWNQWYLQYKESITDIRQLMDNEEALEIYNTVTLEEFSTTLEKLIVDMDGLERWIEFRKAKSQLDEHKMEWFLAEIYKKQIRDVNFSLVFIWSFLNKVLSDVYEKNDILKNFNVNDYELYIEEFRKLEAEVFQTNQYRVLSKVFPMIKFAMDRGGNSEKVLIRESQKIQRHVPIRKLVMENAAHLLNYKPCWMMSPLTLSSYIPYGAVDFDVVIFDEASQMKIENAMGAISRAKQVVVIGDEHQLPPTSFFDVSSEDDEEDDMEEVGYESILQAAITILPGAQSELLYHYRSTSDDLIAFSNEFIYGNRLITFPAPKNNSGAVKFEYVENGVYDAGQTRRNRIEAVRVAELCIEHVKNESSSLGVIAFSKAQEEAIREAIFEKIKDFPELSEKLDEVADKKESFFIKNLESVQGDERDVIILSVGYGPDQNKNIYNRFGPLNAKGGYRRLNVAVTRSKDQIICVSSMKSYEMNPPESSRGAILLQKYLEYAEKGKEVLKASRIATKNVGEADSDFEISVQNALEGLGYVLHRQVGASGFSIDLAVVNPKNNNEYILGIECDGAAYHSSKSARIRDRLRQQILEKLGWHFYRIWSQHWITHKQSIIEDIVAEINKYQ